MEQLNLQAHLNAQAHADEFVKEALVLHDRLGLLVRELLAAEVGAEPSLVLQLVARRLLPGPKATGFL